MDIEIDIEIQIDIDRLFIVCSICKRALHEPFQEETEA